MKLRNVVSVTLCVISLALTSRTFAAPPTNEARRIGNGTARVAAWSPDGNTLAVGGSLGIWLYSPQLKQMGHFDGNDREITALVWNPNGKQIATADNLRKIQLWDVATGQRQTLEATLVVAWDWPDSLSFNPDGTLLATASPANAVNLWDIASGKLKSTLRTPGPVTAVAWNPDGVRLAVGSVQRGFVRNPDNEKDEFVPDGLLQIWEAKTNKLLLTFVRKTDYLYDVPAGPIATIQWYAKGASVVAALGGYPFEVYGEVFAWNMDKNEQGFVDVLQPCGDKLTGVSFAPDGIRFSYGLISCDSGAAFVVINSTDPNAETLGPGLVGGGQGHIQAIAWGPDSTTLAVLTGNGHIFLFDTSRVDANNAYPTTVNSDFEKPPTDARWSADGSQILTTEHTGFPSDTTRTVTIRVKDLLSQQVLQEAVIKGYWIGTLALSPDGKSALASFNDDDTPAILFDATTGAPLVKWDKGEDGSVWAPYKIYWSPDGSRVTGLDCCDDLSIWDAKSATLLKSFTDSSPSWVVWSPDSTHLVKNDGHYNGQPALDVVDVTTGKTLFSLNNIDSKDAKNVLWGPQGRSIGGLGKDKRVRIWQMPSGKLLKSLPGINMAWNADGSRLAIAKDGQSIQLYNTANAKVLTTLKGPTSGEKQLSFSPDGQYLATFGDIPTINVWNVETGQVAATFVGHIGPVEWVQWKPDSKQMMSYGSDATLRIWNLQ